MEYQELSTFAVVGLGLLAAFNLLWTSYKNVREAKKPADELKATVEAHSEMLDRDNKRLRNLEESQRLLLKSMSQIIEHEVTGNDVDALKTMRDEINDYLINR